MIFNSQIIDYRIITYFSISILNNNYSNKENWKKLSQFVKMILLIHSYIHVLYSSYKVINYWIGNAWQVGKLVVNCNKHWLLGTIFLYDFKMEEVVNSTIFFIVCYLSTFYWVHRFRWFFFKRKVLCKYYLSYF